MTKLKKFPKVSWLKKTKGSKTEAPVQAALDTYLDLKGLYNFRIPDSLYRTLKMLYLKGQLSPWVYKAAMKYFKGFCDNMVFIPLTNKYLLACPIECKSATGKTHGKQKVLARKLNYQIPRSPQEAIDIVSGFVKDAEVIQLKIHKKEVDNGK